MEAQVDKHGRIKIVAPYQDTGYTDGVTVRRTSDVTGCSNVYYVSFQSVYAGNSDFWSSGTDIVIPAGLGGWYNMQGMAQLDDTGGTGHDYWSVGLMVNGSWVSLNMGYRISQTSGVNVNVSCMRILNAGDIVKFATIGPTGTYTVKALSYYSPYVSVVRMGGTL